MKTHLITLMLAGLASVTLTYGRPIRTWTAEEMIQASDFLVLAQIDSVSDGPTQTTLMRVVPAQEKRAQLRVVHFFKHDAAVSQMTLKWYQPIESPPNGPSGFVPEIGPYYLLFLKRELGLQRFVSVTSDLDPGRGLLLISHTDKPEILSDASQLDTIMHVLSQSDDPRARLLPRDEDALMKLFIIPKDEQTRQPDGGDKGSDAAIP